MCRKIKELKIIFDRFTGAALVASLGIGAIYFGIMLYQAYKTGVIL